MKALHTLSIILLAITSALIFLCFYWVYLDKDILSFTGPVTTDKMMYSAGDRVTYEASYCKRTTGVATVNRAIVDGYRINYNPVTVDAPAGCRTVKINDLVIPTFLSGEEHSYHLEGVITIKVNPFKTQTVVFKTNDFTIK